MTEIKHKSQKELRLQRNADILRRMRNGDPLNAIDSKASWFPPRPIIKKDLNEMARLYNTKIPREEKRRWETQSKIRMIQDDKDDRPLPEAG